MNVAVSYFQARDLAARHARDLLPDISLARSQENILNDEFIEGNGFWIFFRNKKFIYPYYAELAASAAYAVGLNGVCLTVADFSDRPREMEDLMRRLSIYFSVKE